MNAPEDTNNAVVDVDEAEVGSRNPDVEQVDDELEAGSLAIPAVRCEKVENKRGRMVAY